MKFIQTLKNIWTIQELRQRLTTVWAVMWFCRASTPMTSTP